MSEREARLREIRDRVEKATPGPWYSTEYFQEKEFFYPSGYYGVEIEYQKPFCVVGAFDGSEAEFIAHAREDVPWLLAEVERLREELDGVNCELELRKTLHVQTEESEHIARTSDLLIRTLQENRDLRERLEILECYEEDTRGRLNPDARDIQRMAAFEYPGSAVDG